MAACPGNECGMRNTQCAMGNTELHRAAWNRRLVMLEHPPPAHVIIGPVCIAQSPLSANNIPHSALRIPHSLIVRSTANHPFAPSGKPRGGGPVLGTNAECGMRNAEYRTAQGSVESPACHVGASPPAHVIIGPVCIAQSPLSANNIPHSALRIPHSLIVRSTANHPFAPSVEPRGGGLFWERMRSAECGMRNAEYRAAQSSVESPACHVGASPSRTS